MPASNRVAQACNNATRPGRTLQNPLDARGLRLDPSPAAPLASDNLISLLEGAFSFAIFTRLLLLSVVFLHGVLQSRPPQLSTISDVTLAILPITQ